MPLGTIRLPTVAQLQAVTNDLGITMSEGELALHRDRLVGNIAAYNLLDQMPDELPEIAYHAPRGGVRQPRRTRTAPGT